MSRADNVPTYTMRQLAAFVAVAETGTISAAAERMHLSQSALAAAVTDLERALKVQLTVRKRARGVALTSTGEVVLTRAKALLYQAGELQGVAEGEGGGVAGPLVVGCHPALGPTLLPSLLHDFTQRYPRAKVALREDTQNRLRRRLDDGELDVVIVYDLDLSPEWRTVMLTTRVPTVSLAPDHRLARVNGPVRLADLAADPMVLLDAPPSAEHALEVCARAGFVPKVAYRTQSYETARAFVGRGLGWSLLVPRPRLDVTYEGLAVVVKALAEPPAPIGVVAAWHQDSMPSRVARAFVQFASTPKPPAPSR
ncbi:LysR family transcriptional regulator [Prauserella marina]|uniref:DNA-binding transcriptional regulator, LysR family n=1 Tax=Prauserella marina TaxID=530584 RepID=A0A222VZ81_9PSEU|nr:LysR family transcriptional regulator [Prauserella marina]ASR39256.1 LysR family transcriptional regulator [Prauserella marina]PWV84204.1 DNA-binding transcriptional LysR family regulator [Prauserella marina]SDC28114.1 DNA-binding transcriptional regulator, LysR family [Prauserella marina]